MVEFLVLGIDVLQRWLVDDSGCTIHGGLPQSNYWESPIIGLPCTLPVTVCFEWRRWFSYCLVVWNMNFIYWECHHPNWRTPSFFRGVGWNHQPAYLWGRCLQCLQCLRCRIPFRPGPRPLSYWKEDAVPLGRNTPPTGFLESGMRSALAPGQHVALIMISFFWESIVIYIYIYWCDLYIYMVI